MNNKDQFNQIESIQVKSLFGRFNYEIPFYFNNGGTPGLVIITAPNGYGKSTILRLLNDVANGDYISLARASFELFTINGINSNKLSVTRLQDNEGRSSFRSRGASQVRLLFRHSKMDGDSHNEMSWEITLNISSERDDDDETMFRIDGVDRHLPHLRRVSPYEWRDTRNGNILTRAEVYRLAETRMLASRMGGEEEPTWLSEYRQQLKVLHISANRLRVDPSQRNPRRTRGEFKSDMVEVWAEKIREQIREAIKKYAERGRFLERSFPSKIISMLRSANDVTLGEVMYLTDEIRRSEKRYQDLGLVAEGRTVDLDENLNDKSALVVLKAYLEDIKAKFEAIESTAERLQIFINTINGMLLFKKLRASPDFGFEVISDDGGIVPLNALSSGEQHLLVLMGELVFGSSGGETILLDEPEISFHPEWQESFPSVLRKIISVNHCSVVMATHSPTLIQDNWDSVVELAEQVSQ